MAVTPVSTVHDVIGNVIALLVAVGDADYPHVTGSGLTELLVGERYLGEEGGANRIVFVPTAAGGQLGGPLEIGARQVGSITESVRCYVWGAETVADVSRYDDAAAKCVRLLNCFAASCPGRNTKGAFRRLAETNVVTYGEEYVVELSYTWPVPYDDQVFAAAYAAAPNPPLSPANPDQPNGSTGLTFSVTPTLANTRP